LDKKTQNKPVTKQYDPSDYLKDNEVSSGLAITHEQVSDTYIEGTIDGTIDDLDSKGVQIPRRKE